MNFKRLLFPWVDMSEVILERKKTPAFDSSSLVRPSDYGIGAEWSEFKSLLGDLKHAHIS